MKQLHIEDSANEVPWLSEYYAKHALDESPIRIDWMKFYPKGLMLQNTELAKAFVFKARKLHQFLHEAVEVFVNSEETFPGLYMSIDENGKILVFQEEKEPCYFVKNSAGEIHLQDSSPKAKKKELAKNPFLKQEPHLPPSQEKAPRKSPKEPTT